MSLERKAGVLLHITSLPSNYGVGTLGKEAYEFVDWLKESNQKIWQVLPLVPTNYGDSPYQSVSSTALNYYLIDLDILHEKGLLLKKDYHKIKFSYDSRKVDYSLLFIEKIKVLKKAFSNFNINDTAFKRFEKKGDYKSFAVFMTIKAMHNYSSFDNWSDGYRNHSDIIFNSVIENYKNDYLFWVWTQYEFLDEWNKLHKYAKGKGIEIMGDMPLYVAYDSVEVWKNPEMFVLNEDKTLKLVAGCPPDCFSADGQLWGNPIYDWDYMKRTNYKWWDERLKKAFMLYDIVRIDHFRGFDRYYAIDSKESTARNGKWLDGPKFDLFKDKTNLNIVAEDLGFVDDGVITLLRQTGYPGMKIMEFAFDGNKDNEHKPSNYEENYIVYTGTHDNEPMYSYIKNLDSEHLNIFKNDLKNECKLLNVKYRGQSEKALLNTVIELGYASKAKYAIFPIQDLLNEDNDTRMNLPSTVSTDNWSYRISKRDLSSKLSSKLKEYSKKYRRI